MYPFSSPGGAFFKSYHRAGSMSGVFSSQEEMSWRQFENHVHYSLYNALDENRWRIKAQTSRSYKDRAGGNVISVRMDFHIAERRQGGCGFVIDAKHYRVAPLATNAVDDTIEYKRLCKASKAIIIYSEVTKVPPSLKSYAESKKLWLVKANRNLKSNLSNLFDGFLM